MADDLTNYLEARSSVVLDKKTGKKFIVDNITLMYTSEYDDKERYVVIGEAHEEDI